MAKQTNYGYEFGPLDYKVDGTTIAKYAGLAGINTVDGAIIEGSTPTFSGNKKQTNYILVSEINGGVGEFAFDYKSAKADEGKANIEVLVDDVSKDVQLLQSAEKATYKLSIQNSGAKTIKIQVKDPSLTSNGQRIGIDNVRWTTMESAAVVK